MATRSSVALNFLQQLAPYAGERYMPNQTILEKTRSLRVGSIEAITGAGKSHMLINAVPYAKEHSNILPVHIARSSVTREMRESERNGNAEYRRYYDVTKEQHQRELRDLLVNRNAVQAEVHPTTGHIYLTEWEAYKPDAFNIVNLMADARQRIIRKGILKNVAQACLVPGDMLQWRDFLRGRDNTMSDLEEFKRIKEGQVSLRGSLANPDMQFVINKYDNNVHIDVIRAWSGELPGKISQAGRTAAEFALEHLDMLVAMHPAREAYEAETASLAPATA
jgi:hypothetical protein